MNKNDPNDARPGAVAAMRPEACLPVRRDDHAAVLKIRAKRLRNKILGTATDKFPEATRIVGLYHAREPSLPHRVLKVHAARPQRRVARRRPEGLDYGDIDGIEAAIRQYPVVEGAKKDEAERNWTTP